ncbi:MAG: M1 family metallopeptidase [Cellulomonas sp.]
MGPGRPAATVTVDPYVPGHGNPGFTVTRYELDLDYRVASNRLVARARLHVTATEPLTKFTLDLAGLRVTKVTVNGRRPSRYTHRSGKLQIVLEATVGAGTSLVVDVDYSGQPQPIVGFWGEVGWEELADGAIVAGQPDGAPSWFPCDDHPRDKASFRTTVTTDPGYTVVANGTQLSRTALASRVRWVFDQPEPTSTYLATVQIGRYEPVRMNGSAVPQRALVPGHLVQKFRHDFGRQKEMLALFVELFGPYPFAEYTVVVTADNLEIPLEAQGMSVFGANHVDGRRGHERLVAHELAHQWFGNSVTVGRWQDIWLHEGFACYAEWLWSERAGGPTAATIARVAWRDLRAEAQDILVGDPGPALMFDDRIYRRGALTLHSIRTVVGDTAFFELLRSWTRTHAHGSVSTQDFIDCAARFTDEPLRHLFEGWLFRTELPPLISASLSRSVT